MTDELEPTAGESPDELMERIGAQEGTEGTPPKEKTPPADTKIKIGDDEFTPEELATQRQEWLRAQEIEKGGRAKFDEAAELRKEVDAKEQEIADIKLIVNVLQNGTPQQKAMILKELGDTFQGDEIDESAFTENETLLLKKLNKLESENRQLAETLGKVGTTLEEIRKHTATKQEAEQMQSNIATIKEKTGMDVSPELLANWKENGITDPVKAALGVMLPMLQAVQKPTDKPKDEIPDATKTNTFNPDEYDPDEIFDRVVRQGMVPSK
jgi:hypothetical protein